MDLNKFLTVNHLPVGYRIFIEGDVQDNPTNTAYQHSSGGEIEGNYSKTNCPICSTQLFPIFKFDHLDQRVLALNLWDLPFLQVLVCPYCFFGYMPYWIWFQEKQIEVEYEDFDTSYLPPKDESGSEFSYETVSISLDLLQENDYPISNEIIKAFINRQREPGIYHQLGGVSPTGDSGQMKCNRCKLEMVFAGVIDSDTENVPIYQNEEMIGFLIADCHKLYFYTCKPCHVIGVQRMAC